MDYLLTLANRLYRGQVSSGKLHSGIRLLRSWITAPRFFADPAVGIPLADGFLMITPSGVELRPHDPRHLNRHVMRGAWPTPEDASRGLLDALMGSFQGDPEALEKILALQQFAAAVAMGIATRVKQPKAFILLGRTGNNGKSQILDLIKSLVPEDKISALKIDMLASDNYRYIPKLSGVLFNADDDMPDAEHHQ